MTVWQPRSYQLELVEDILSRPGQAAWARVGSGKTSATLAALEVMKQRAGWRALVVAPKNVALNVWQQEIEKWGFGLSSVVLHGPKKAARRTEKVDVYIINYDGLSWLVRAGLPPFDVLVLDESSKCRNTDTTRFRVLRDAIMPRAKRVVALSGTPKPNGEMNLFGQYRLVDGGERLGRFITHFRRRYCYQTGYGGYTWELLPGAASLIRAAVSDITTIVEADDVVGLPETVVTDVEVPLPASARKQYDRLEATFFAELDEGEVTAVNAASLVAKLRQMASGAVYTDHPRYEVVHDARIEALESIYEEVECGLLVAYNFEHEALEVARAFPDAVNFTRLSDAKKVEAVRTWNAGGISMLLVHPASAGHGLNLQGGGNALVFYSLLYDLELYEQTIGRIARIGQRETRAWVYRLVAPETVDIAMVRALEAKAAGQEDFLVEMRSYRERGRK